MVIDKFPPVPVLVDVGSLLAVDIKPQGKVKLSIRATGLDLSAPVPGLLHQWVATRHGTWLGLVEMTLTSPNGHTEVWVRQLVPAQMIKQVQ